MWIHWELAWISMSKIRCLDCKICKDLQYRRCIVQDQTYWAWSVYYQNVLDVFVWSLGSCLTHYEQDQTSWLQDLHRSVAKEVFIVRSATAEHDLCMIKTSRTFCVFIGSLSESLWARSDILIARSAQICYTGGVYCKISNCWAWFVQDQNVQDVLCVNWEHTWVIMSKIRCLDCKIRPDQQHKMCLL